MAGAPRGRSETGPEPGAWDGGRLALAGFEDGLGGGRLEACPAAEAGERGACGGETGRRALSGLSASALACVPEASPSVFFLWSRQHSAQRHSTTKSPFRSRRLESRHPNCALISV